MKETLRERAPGEDFNKRVRRVLEQVPRAGFYSGGDVCPEDITFPSCMAAVMRYLGTDYPWLPLVAHNRTWRLNYGNVFFVGAKREVRRMMAGILLRAMAKDQETAKLLARALTVMG